MWHEARKQEKKIREVMVDFQKRAERRREHYEKLRGDPNQLLRITGTKCRLHLDPTGGERDSSMIPWQGDSTNLISRYDVRMHLDFIPDYSKMSQHEMSTDEKVEEDKCNYERYRNVVINLAQGVSEVDALAKIDVDETIPVLPFASDFHNEKKKLAKTRMAIAYDYGAGTSVMAHQSAATHSDSDDDDNKKSFSSEGEYEMDVDIDDMSTRQTDQLNLVSSDYGISSGKFCRALRNEKALLLERKEIRLAELEKQAFSGKKARRERRMLKEFQLRGRANTPPSYTTRGSPSYEPYCREEWSASSSRSSSPNDKEGEVQFITEFGSEAKETEKFKKSRWDSRTRTGASSFSSRQHARPRHQRRQSTPSPPRHSRSRRLRSRSRERYGSSYRSGHRFRSRSQSRSPSHDRFRRRSYSRSPRGSKRSHSRSRSRSRERDNVELKMEQKLSRLKPNSGKTPKPLKKTDKTKLTPAERLKKKMQQQLSRTYKQEKRSEKEKAEAREAEKLEREEEMKEEMRKLKEREKQRWYRDHGNETPPRRRDRSRSRSWSPPYYRY